MVDFLPFFDLNNDELFETLNDLVSGSHSDFSLVDSLDDLCKNELYKNLTNDCLSMEGFNAKFSNQYHDLSCLHLNIQSLNSKLDDFIQLVNSLDYCFDVICLSEVWATNIQFYTNILQDYIFHFDLPKSGIVGGVGIFLHKTLKFKLRNDLYISSSTNNAVENIWFEITKFNKKYIIGCIYRHPNSHIIDFYKLFESTMNKINKRKTPCVVLGDINIDLLKLSSSSAVSDYTGHLISNNFLPCLLLPSRVTSHSSTLIDHIYFCSSNLDNKLKIHCGNILCDISDHFPNFFILKHHKHVDMLNRPFIRIFSPKNKIKFNQKLNAVDWSAVFMNDNIVDNCYQAFVTTLSIVFEECFPLVRISRKAFKNKSWFTSDLRKLLNEKNNLYKIWLKSLKDDDKLKYLDFKKFYSKKCRGAKISYYQNIFDVKSSTTKKIWKHLNDLLANKGSKQSNTIDKLTYNDKTFYSDLDIANAFNHHFVNVGCTLANALPISNISYKSYLNPPVSNSIYVNPVSVVEVYNLIKNSSGGKAAGDDGFNLELVKNNAMV